MSRARVPHCCSVLGLEKSVLVRARGSALFAIRSYRALLPFVLGLLELHSPLQGHKQQRIDFVYFWYNWTAEGSGDPGAESITQKLIGEEMIFETRLRGLRCTVIHWGDYDMSREETNQFQ